MNIIARSKGFTLIEIMITVSIIAVLTTVILSFINPTRSKANDERRIADIKQIQEAANVYFSSCYSFPTTLAILKNGSSDCPAYVPALVTFPTDPVTHTDYLYFTDAPSTGKRYHVCATLQNSFTSNSGKTNKSPFVTGDPCDGTKDNVFDAAGGVY